MKRNPGQVSRLIPDFAGAQSGLLVCSEKGRHNFIDNGHKPKISLIDVDYAGDYCWAIIRDPGLRAVIIYVTILCNDLVCRPRLIGVRTAARAKFERAILDRSAPLGLVVEAERTVMDFLFRNRASIDNAAVNPKKILTVYNLLRQERWRHVVVKPVSNKLVFGPRINGSSIEIDRSIDVAKLIYWPWVSLNIDIGHLFSIDRDLIDFRRPPTEVNDIGRGFFSHIFIGYFYSYVESGLRLAIETSTSRTDPSARTSDVAFSHRAPLQTRYTHTYGGCGENCGDKGKLNLSIYRESFYGIPKLLPSLAYFVTAVGIWWIAGLVWLCGQSFGRWRYFAVCLLIGWGGWFIHAGMLWLEEFIVDAQFSAVVLASQRV